MLNNKQKMFLHIYADAASLSDPAYRDILKTHAGVCSSADRMFSQAGFDGAMSALETVLFDRVHAGVVPDPRGQVRYISSEFYWRTRNPGVGRINSRQAHKINQLWNQLCEWIPADQHAVVYFAGIVHRATGKQDIGLSALSSSEADSVINALKDRLSYAIRKQPVMQEDPF